MKATGEVMAMAPSFEMAIMKAVRGAEISLDTLNLPEFAAGDARERLHAVDDRRLFAIFAALKAGVSVDEIHAVTRVDRWFLYKLERLARFELEAAGGPLDKSAYIAAKRLGYTDKALLRITGHSLPASREAVYKMVDTCGGGIRRRDALLLLPLMTIRAKRGLSREPAAAGAGAGVGTHPHRPGD
jgi:carbamoyl-phosphate synthase large subunit